MVARTKLPLVNVLVASSQDVEFEERKTKLAIWYRFTSSPFVFTRSVFLIPLPSDNQPDFHVMTGLMDDPWGLEDWDPIPRMIITEES